MPQRPLGAALNGDLMTTGQTDDVGRLPRAAAALLARLAVPAGRLPPTMAALRKGVAGVVGPLTDAGWSAAVAALTDAGLATAATASAAPAARRGTGRPAPLHLTGPGRTAAQDRLGSLADGRPLTARKVQSHWAHRQPRSAVPAVLLTVLYVEPLAVKPLRTAVQKVTGPLDDAAWSAAVSAALSAGHVNAPAPPPARPLAPRPSLALTDAGRAAAARPAAAEPSADAT